MSVRYRVRDLRVIYPGQAGLTASHHNDVVAVDGVSLDIRDGEALGVVGESGSGKTSLGMAMLKAIAVSDGSLEFSFAARRPDGDDESEGLVDITRATGGSLTRFRRSAQMVFQDPYSSLNPRMTVFEIISEPLVIAGTRDRQQLNELVRELISVVGLDSTYMNRLPHEFSGGQRQRIAVARALAIRPKFLVADEPTSALDVSVQAQVLNLLQVLKQEFELTMLLISHDLGVVKHVCDRIAVMYMGRIVEVRETDDLFSKPHHPYTEMLLRSAPRVTGLDAPAQPTLPDDFTNQLGPPEGCRYSPRCQYATDQCRSVDPRIGESDMSDAACIRHQDLSLKGTMLSGE